MHMVAFKMHLNKDAKEEYKKRHDAIWPELVELLKEAGIKDYSIFLDEETSTLIGVLKMADPGKLDELSSKEIMKKWWSHMKDLMETLPGDQPVSIPLSEVFHMD